MIVTYLAECSRTSTMQLGESNVQWRADLGVWLLVNILPQGFCTIFSFSFSSSGNICPRIAICSSPQWIQWPVSYYLGCSVMLLHRQNSNSLPVWRKWRWAAHKSERHVWRYCECLLQKPISQTRWHSCQCDPSDGADHDMYFVSGC